MAAATPAAAGALFGSWRLVRLKKAVPCDACHGTVEQETFEGGKEVFSCDVTLQPGEGGAIVLEGTAASVVSFNLLQCLLTLLKT